MRGHDVTLYEKSNVLGGNLIPAGAHDFKREVNGLNEYYKHQMDKFGIDVKLNTEVTTEILKNMKADAIILAVGSVPVMPKIEGIDHLKTVSGVDALLEKKPIGDKVVIVGGGLVGCEIAYGYAKEGKDVTIVEALDKTMKTNNVPAMNKIMLLDAFEYYGTKVLTSARLNAVTDDGAVVTLSDGTTTTFEADNVIMSVGYRPAPLAEAGKTVHLIGDCNKVGNLRSVIWGAWDVAMKI